MRNQDEFKLSCVVADFLGRALPTRALYTHFPAGEKRSEATGARLKRMGMQRGWPDYLIILDGVTYGIELKAGKGKPSDVQLAVADAFVANGSPWVCARSTQEVEQFLIDNGVQLKARIVA